MSLKKWGGGQSLDKASFNNTYEEAQKSKNYVAYFKFSKINDDMKFLSGAKFQIVGKDEETLTGTSKYYELGENGGMEVTQEYDNGIEFTTIESAPSQECYSAGTYMTFEINVPKEYEKDFEAGEFECFLKETRVPDGYKGISDIHLQQVKVSEYSGEKSYMMPSDNRNKYIADYAKAVLQFVIDGAQIGHDTWCDTCKNAGKTDALISEVQKQECFNKIDDLINERFKNVEDYTDTDNAKIWSEIVNYLYDEDGKIKGECEFETGLLNKQLSNLSLADKSPYLIFAFTNEKIQYSVNIKKTDVAGEVLKGATLIVQDKEGNEVFRQENSDGTETITVVPGTYTLIEESAPDGYKVAESITFSVDKDGKVTVGNETVDEVVMVDKYEEQTVNIKKTDVAGEVLKGATLIVQDKDGKEVFRKENSDGTETITVVPGTYTLIEESAPDGYKVAESITFSVDKEGKVTVGNETVDEVVMVDKKTSVQISKVDFNSGKALEGAVIQLLDKDGNVIKKWVSTKEVQVIKGLKTGETYTLKEKTAPKGYNITSNTTFELNPDGTINTSKTTTKVKDGILLIQDKKKSNVDTGAGNGMKLYGTIAIVAFVFIVGMVIVQKKKKQ